MIQIATFERTCVLIGNINFSEGSHEDTGRVLVFSRRACRCRWVAQRADDSLLHRIKRLPACDGPRPARGHHPAVGGAIPQPQVHRHRGGEVAHGADRQGQRGLWRRAGETAYAVLCRRGCCGGGAIAAVTSNMALLGNGTDTGNSIRMPSATSSVVGVFPTRGLVSIAGIAPLDWLLDNTGPIARDVTDAVIALDVMAGEDSMDSRTAGSAAKAQPGPYTPYLKADALMGQRFGVAAVVPTGAG